MKEKGKRLYRRMSGVASNCFVFFWFVLSIDLSPFYQVWIVYQLLVLLSSSMFIILKNSILASTDSPTASNGSTIGTT